MSDLMYDEIGVMPNSTFKKGDWRKIAVHDDKHVYGFFGDYRWLSNFHLCHVMFEGLLYPSSENAYQAAKVAPQCRSEFQRCSPAESKRLWKKDGMIRLHRTNEEWDKVKFSVMSTVVFDKFLRNEDLRGSLLQTGDRELREDNWWKDVYYGYDCNMKQGKNVLGGILMSTRAYWECSLKNKVVG